MTYCCGVLVREGLVMVADTRTNAGLDNISTFRKLHVFSKPGDRILAVASAGNLSISQSVLSTLTEGLENTETGERETLISASSMFQAAQLIGRAIRHVNATEAQALKAEDINYEVSFLFGGQIKGERMRLFMIYPAAISSNAPSTRRICKSASTNTASRCSIARLLTTSNCTRR